ncbi:hypothetical protein L596_003675 [Steinernema carpocapsae]|uniref:Uncharacterized protein n=1 Tax=Steinernema carpocapsae TaxID=34508 RepID=A0A4U8UTB2_STECR|nr:hypothetical protein L596_003675 [Steinernema carpocapsae]
MAFRQLVAGGGRDVRRPRLVNNASVSRRRCSRRFCLSVPSLFALFLSFSRGCSLPERIPAPGPFPPNCDPICRLE